MGDGGQRFGQPGRQAIQHRRVQRAASPDVLGQRGPVGVFGDQERAGRGGVGRYHPHRAYAPDPDERGHLTAEPGPELRVANQFGLQHLHRDLAAVLVRGEVHHTHPARTEPGDQPVPADPRRIGVP